MGGRGSRVKSAESEAVRGLNQSEGAWFSLGAEEQVQASTLYHKCWGRVWGREEMEQGGNECVRKGTNKGVRDASPHQIADWSRGQPAAVKSCAAAAELFRGPQCLSVSSLSVSQSLSASVLHSVTHSVTTEASGGWGK